MISKKIHKKFPPLYSIYCTVYTVQYIPYMNHDLTYMIHDDFMMIHDLWKVILGCQNRLFRKSYWDQPGTFWGGFCVTGCRSGGVPGRFWGLFFRPIFYRRERPEPAETARNRPKPAIHEVKALVPGGQHGIFLRSQSKKSHPHCWRHTSKNEPHEG